jgi:C1A family cysteine protease
MILRDALASVCANGDVPKDLFPYNEEVNAIYDRHYNEVTTEMKAIGKENRLTSYYRVTTENDIKTALSAGSPVVISVRWYKDIKVINGVITTSKLEDSNTGNHCILIYGWNKQGWKILNSWGTGWGNQGTAILPYEIPIREAWGVCDNYNNVNAYGLDIKKPFSSALGKLLAKCLNLIYNFLKKKVS